MSQIVNLNKRRKDTKRAQDKKQADQNAAFYGLSKAQKELAKKQRSLAEKKLSQNLRPE